MPYIPMSIAWCKECLKAGVIPYWALVGNTSLIGAANTSDDWNDLIDRTLAYFDKTMETFLEDVERGAAKP